MFCSLSERLEHLFLSLRKRKFSSVFSCETSSAPDLTGDCVYNIGVVVTSSRYLKAANFAIALESCSQAGCDGNAEGEADDEIFGRGLVVHFLFLRVN